MRVVKNDALIKRNGRIGQYTTLGALGVLAIGMYISIKRQDLFFYALAALVIGFVLTQIGMSFSTRFGRSPRPDEQLDLALKGLPGDTTLYHYTTPVAHLLAGPGGLWVLRIYHQRGKLTYSRNRWRLAGGGFAQAYMSIFGQEGLGRPDVDMGNEIAALQKYLAQKLEPSEIPEIQGALVFSNEEAEVDAPDAPMPAMKIKQLKEFVRQKVKERIIPPLQLERIQAVLGGEEAPED